MSVDILGTSCVPMPKHGSINLYIHGNQKARLDGQLRTATSTLTQLLNYVDCFNTDAKFISEKAQKKSQVSPSNLILFYFHITLPSIATNTKCKDTILNNFSLLNKLMFS